MIEDSPPKEYNYIKEGTLEERQRKRPSRDRRARSEAEEGAAGRGPGGEGAASLACSVLRLLRPWSPPSAAVGVAPASSLLQETPSSIGGKGLGGLYGLVSKPM